MNASSQEHITTAGKEMFTTEDKKKFRSVQQVSAHLADELLEQDVEDATENALISSEEMVLMQTAIGNILNPTNGMQENV